MSQHVLNRGRAAYFPALDGARGWSAIGVLVAHVNLAWFPGAMILMDLFFVISGFLITSILWRSVRKRKRVSLARFWRRRLMRLYPALLLVVVSCTLMACVLVEDPVPSLQDALATLLYYSNWTKLEGSIYPTLFGQTWSLGIEEQFYLLWPLIFLAALKLRLSVPQTVTLLVALALTCMAWRYYLIAGGASWSRLYYALDTRMDAFAIGGILAVIYPYLRDWSLGAVAHVLLTLGVLTFGVLLYVGTPREVEYFYWQQSAAVVLSAVMVILLVSPRIGFVQRVFSSKLSIFLGQRCYSIYLWHWPIIWLLLVNTDFRDGSLLMVVLPLVLLLSSLTYAWVELPFMSRRFVPMETITIAAPSEEPVADAVESQSAISPQRS